MNGIKEVIPLLITLFICTIDGYSMMNYRQQRQNMHMHDLPLLPFFALLSMHILPYISEAPFFMRLWCLP